VFQEAYVAERIGNPLASNYLLNGMNVKPDGSAGRRFQQTFVAGKKYLIRLINTSVENFMTVAIDGHTMTVISSDFVPITPYTTNGVKINIGQRYDVIVTANQPVSNYWLRAMVGQCSRNANNGLGSIANGIITYQGASNGTLPKTSPASFSGTCADEPAASLVPIVTKSVDSSSFASQVQILPAGLSSISNTNDNVFRWTLNGISEVIDWAEPTLIDIASGQNNFSRAENVVTLPTANVWVYFVVESQMPMEHPFHIHGHDFSILGTGTGTFSTSQTRQLNFASPVRRDVTTLPASGWTVIAFKTDNPGAWLLHCHIAWHASEGLSIQFLEVPSQIPAKYPVSAAQQQTCANWKAYGASGPMYTQIDSGLKKRHLVRHARSHSSHRAF
jgi:FtsP/CotA-like multicopper oxidase with cupredoxin domain